MNHQLLPVGIVAAAALSLAACGGGNGAATGGAGMGSSSPPAVSNTAPSVSGLPQNQTILQDAVGEPVAFSVSDKETRASDLTVSVQSSNADLIEPADIDVGGNGNDRSVVLRPKMGMSGSSKITVLVTDSGGMKSSQELDLEVTAQQTSYTSFVQDTLTMPSGSDPVETSGNTWTEIATDNPSAFDQLFP